MRLSRLAPAVFTLALAAAPAHAQQWAAPLFSSPLNQDRFEILASDANGAGIGIAAAVRPFARVPDLRLRAGIMDGYGTGAFDRPSAGLTRRRPTAYMVGLDYARPLNPNAGGPVRASLVTGIGVGVNEANVVSVPLGISVGYDGGRIRPYVTPRMVLEHHSNAGIDDGVHVRAVIDWGVDIDLPLGGTLRAALTTGSYLGGGIGFSF
jgi:hypothetical protein